MATPFAAKRGRADASEEDPFEAFRAELMGHVDKSLADLNTKTMESTINLVKKQDEKFERRFSNIEKELIDLRRAQDAVEKSHKEQEAISGKLQEAMALAEAAIPIKAELDLDDFNRQVDTTILRVNASEFVPKPEVERVLRPWLEEAGCDDNGKAEVLGPDSARKFTVHFKGLAGLAQNRLRKARALLRNPGGAWREFPVLKTSAGGEIDKIYIDIDKNGCQLKREFDGKRLRQTFQHLYPSKHIVFNKADGLFCYHGQPLALLEPQIDGPSKIKWHLVAVANADVNRADVQADFLSRQRARARAADVPWSG